MWPFSTIRNLRWELAQAERANETLRQKMHNANTEWRKAHRSFADLKNSDIKRLTTQRDEAICIANTLEMACAYFKRQLQGALVRDPKTGRMAKWVDPK